MSFWCAAASGRYDAPPFATSTALYLDTSGLRFAAILRFLGARHIFTVTVQGYLTYKKKFPRTLPKYLDTSGLRFAAILRFLGARHIFTVTVKRQVPAPSVRVRERARQRRATVVNDGRFSVCQFAGVPVCRFYKSPQSFANSIVSMICYS